MDAIGSESVAGLASDLADVLARLVARLRTMPAAKLAAPPSAPVFAVGSAPTRADAGRALARAVVMATQGIESAAEAEMPAWRELPALPDLAVGDQLSVVAHDLAVGVASVRGPADTLVWTPQGRRPLLDVLRDLVAVADEVERGL